MINATAVFVGITSQQQKGSVIVVMPCSEQRDAITNEDKEEYGVNKTRFEFMRSKN